MAEGGGLLNHRRRAAGKPGLLALLAIQGFNHHDIRAIGESGVGSRCTGMGTAALPWCRAKENEMRKPKITPSTIQLQIKERGKPSRIEDVSVINAETGEELLSNPNFKTAEGWSKR